MELPEINSERWLDPEDLQHEVWAPIDRIKPVGRYEVSNFGRVRTKQKSGYHIYTLRQLKIEYYRVRLRGRDYYVHQLVATAFCEKPTWKVEVDHINAKRTDNRAENLRWVTHRENLANPNNKGKRKKGPYIAPIVFVEVMLPVTLEEIAIQERRKKPYITKKEGGGFILNILG